MLNQSTKVTRAHGGDLHLQSTKGPRADACPNTVSPCKGKQSYRYMLSSVEPDYYERSKVYHKNTVEMIKMSNMTSAGARMTQKVELGTSAQRSPAKPQRGRSRGI